MAVITLDSLEGALINTIDRISALEKQKTEITSSLNTEKANLEKAKNTSFPFAGMKEMAISALENRIVSIEANLTGIEESLKSEYQQKIIDQEAVRDFKVSNMTPDELSKFLEVEQKAKQSEAAFGLGKNVIIGVFILLFVILLIWAYIRFKKSKNK